MSNERSISKFLGLVSEEVDLSPDEKLIYKQAIKILELEKKLMDKDTESFIKHIQKQIPITPESLEGIGFKLGYQKCKYFWDIPNSNFYLIYDSTINEFTIEFDETPDINSDIDTYTIPLHFASTEQIQEFVKCFQAKEGK